MATQQETTQTAKRQFTGVVKSVKENKTIHVTVQSVKVHPKYRKQYMMSKSYAVHDENNTAQEGDTVVFEECRPISKTKKWRLISIVK